MASVYFNVIDELKIQADFLMTNFYHATYELIFATMVKSICA